jgi:predicted DNA-binding transcriptional regulator AlpA
LGLLRRRFFILIKRRLGGKSRIVGRSGLSPGDDNDSGTPTVPPTKREKPQSPWLRREVLSQPSQPSDDETPTAPERVIVGSRLLDPHEVCEIVGASYPTLWTWMRAGKFPRGRIFGGKTKWISTEIADFMANLPMRRLKGDGA